jgi:hypothetical protein
MAQNLIPTETEPKSKSNSNQVNAKLMDLTMTGNIEIQAGCGPTPAYQFSKAHWA